MVSASRSNPRRVLLVEDEDNMATLIQTMLASDSRMELVGLVTGARP